MPRRCDRRRGHQPDPSRCPRCQLRPRHRVAARATPASVRSTTRDAGRRASPCTHWRSEGDDTANRGGITGENAAIATLRRGEPGPPRIGVGSHARMTASLLWATFRSLVTRRVGSLIACATRRASNGSPCSGRRWSTAVACSGEIGRRENLARAKSSIAPLAPIARAAVPPASAHYRDFPYARCADPNDFVETCRDFSSCRRTLPAVADRPQRDMRVEKHSHGSPGSSP